MDSCEMIARMEMHIVARSECDLVAFGAFICIKCTTMEESIAALLCWQLLDDLVPSREQL